MEKLDEEIETVILSSMERDTVEALYQSDPSYRNSEY